MQTLKYRIIVLSDDWMGLPFSCKHIIKYFLTDIPVIWVETIGLRSPQIKLYDINRIVQKFNGWFIHSNKDKKNHIQNLKILNPIQIPFNQIKMIRILNKYLIIKTLNSYKNRVKDDYMRVVITTWPFLGNIIGNLNEDLSIYYRVDDFSEYPGVNKSTILNLERELIEKIDIVIASAEKLTEIDNFNGVIKYIPHGVDYDHFNINVTEVYEKNYLEHIPKPRIGFFGLLNSWLDLDLIKEIASKNPKWSFILIGPSQLSESEIPKLHNIHYIGPIQYEKLPSYAVYFDVALIPFKINKLTLATNPLKLMEYFALGLPVVSTPLPEVLKYEDDVYIASDLRSFELSINNAISENNSNLINKRKDIARKHSWKLKSQEFRNVIDEALEKKFEFKK